MANHEINEDQDALTRALRMIETGDPVHADVYNALFSVLINNDVFLEKLANKMIQQAMISHVTDCTNPDMVMGADQGPVFTQLIEKVKKQVDVLNTNEKGRLIYEVADCTTDPHCILPIPQKDGYRAASAISHDPQYAMLIYHYGFHAIPVDYITLNRAGAGTTIRVGILYVKIN